LLVGRATCVSDILDLDKADHGGLRYLEHFAFAWCANAWWADFSEARAASSASAAARAATCRACGGLHAENRPQAYDWIGRASVLPRSHMLVSPTIAGALSEVSCRLRAPIARRTTRDRDRQCDWCAREGAARARVRSGATRDDRWKLCPDRGPGEAWRAQAVNAADLRPAFHKKRRGVR
jgi:hypothetical protein